MSEDSVHSTGSVGGSSPHHGTTGEAWSQGNGAKCRFLLLKALRHGWTREKPREARGIHEVDVINAQQGSPLCCGSLSGMNSGFIQEWVMHN